ncbi:hypothetical protein CEXT_172001, partial [Caerostris extrusa]
YVESCLDKKGRVRRQQQTEQQMVTAFRPVISGI